MAAPLSIPVRSGANPCAIEVSSPPTATQSAPKRVEKILWSVGISDEPPVMKTRSISALLTANVSSAASISSPAPENRNVALVLSDSWRELSQAIRFDRACGRCEHCRRPHRLTVIVAPDGLWWDEARQGWRYPPRDRLADSANRRIGARYRSLERTTIDSDRDHSEFSNLPRF